MIMEIPEELLSGAATSGKRSMNRREESGFADGRTASRGEGTFAGRGNIAGKAGQGERTAMDYRPKAIVRPKVTPKADKPFIAKGIGSLNQLAGISKGMPYKAPEKLGYDVGDRVTHTKYGEGTVTNISKEERDYKGTVNFDRAGQKIMYATFAKLKRL